MDVIQPMQMIHAEDLIQAAGSNLFRFSYGLDPYSCLLANGGHCLTSDHRGVFMDLTIVPLFVRLDGCPLISKPDIFRMYFHPEILHPSDASP